MATRASLVAEGDHAFFRTYDAAGKSIPFVHRRKGWTTEHYELIAGV